MTERRCFRYTDGGADAFGEDETGAPGLVLDDRGCSCSAGSEGDRQARWLGL